MKTSDKIKALINKFGEDDTSGLLNITKRSLYNYMGDITRPYPKTQRLIDQHYENLGKTNKPSLQVIQKEESSGSISYLEQRRQKMLAEKEVWFPIMQGNTRLKEQSNLDVYDDDPEMHIPIAFLPQTMYPGCDYGERAFGNSMYPRIANQGFAIGRTIDKSRIIFGELYGIHLTGNNPPVIKYIQQCDQPGTVVLVSENKVVKDQVINLDDITFIFRVLYIVNPA